MPPPFLPQCSPVRGFTCHLSAFSFSPQDSSTQGLKATLVNNKLEVVGGAAINYERDLPRFKTTNGIYDRGNGVITTPSLMVRLKDWRVEKARSSSKVQPRCRLKELTAEKKQKSNGQTVAYPEWQAQSINNAVVK